MDKEKIGAFLCSLRKNNNMTQEDIATKLFTSRENVSKWERGINMPTPDTLLELSKIYSVSVNEILLGERKSKENSSRVDNISLEVLRESHRKTKRIIKYFLTIITILIVSFLTYYFINTYNSVHVFFIGGSTEDFDMLNGVAFFSKEKSYIRLGKINCRNKCNIDRITFMYTDNNKDEHQVYSSDEIDYILTSSNDSKQYFSYNDMYNIINNSYVIISHDDIDDILKLDFYKDMSNNGIFQINNGRNLEEDKTKTNINDDISLLEEYFRTNYNYDIESNNYYKKMKDDNKNISIYYSINTFTVSVFEEYVQGQKEYSYNIYNKILKYCDNLVINSIFIYDIYNNKCMDGNCNNLTINYFIDNYLNKFR